jgi:hypothetical protein
MINRVAFFNRLKTYNLYQKINKSQVQGIEATLNEWESNPKKYNNIKYLAYILATFYHETAKTLQPIEEYGKGAGRSYGSKLKYGGGPGKRVPYTTPR